MIFARHTLSAEILTDQPSDYWRSDIERYSLDRAPPPPRHYLNLDDMASDDGLDSADIAASMTLRDQKNETFLDSAKAKEKKDLEDAIDEEIRAKYEPQKGAIEAEIKSLEAEEKSYTQELWRSEVQDKRRKLRVTEEEGALKQAKDRRDKLRVKVGDLKRKLLGGEDTATVPVKTSPANAFTSQSYSFALGGRQ